MSKFEYIDPTPLGSASVSQVHRATYQGKDVVIKVRKPGVEDGLKADLSFLYISSVVLEFVDPNLKKTSLANIVEDIRESMLGELDFVKEGRRLEEFREVRAARSCYKRVAWQRSNPAFLSAVPFARGRR